MGSEINNSICPHCGAEGSYTPEVWLNTRGGGGVLQCSNCKKTFSGDQSSASLVGKHTDNRNFNTSFFIIVFCLLALMVYLNRIFSILTFKEDSGQIIYEIVIILVVSSALSSGKIRQNLKNVAIWIAIFIVLIAGYSYRHDLAGIKEKILVEIIPSKGIQETQNSVSFPVSSDGHFYIRAVINGVPIIFLADTGASDIVFSPADAKKLGIKTDELPFNRLYETANGTVRGSSIRIDDLRIGEIHLKEIGASINEAEMRNSLLGMTFFKHLKSYEVKNDVLTLYWRE